MDDWRTRIGSDPWKNLIAEECDAVGDRGRDEHQGPAEPTTPPPLGKGACFCYFPIVESLTNPNRRSYLVFQSGRLFLVGAPREAVQSFKTAGASLPHHIVLLTWEVNHIQGLLELLDLYQLDDCGVTIWTSSWIWEETLRWFSGQDVEKARILQELHTEGVESNGENTLGVGEKYRVVVFERHLDFRLAFGVRLRIDYVPSKLPCLKATFQCNHLEITINPLDAISSESQLDAVCKRLKAAIRSFPSVQDDFSVRHTKLQESMRVTRDQPGFRAPSGGGWQNPAPPEPWMFKDPIDLGMVGLRANAVRFVAQSASPNSTVAQRANARKRRVSGGGAEELSIAPVGCALSQDEAKEILSGTVIAILCGGLAANRQKDLFTPSRRLSVSLSNGEMSVLSILEWRLHQIYDLANRCGVEDLPLLLMTSPDTEEVVYEQATRFEDLAQSETKRLRISYLPQQLVPEVHETDHGLQPVQKPDGGWTLYARGHLDFLHLVSAWSQKERPGFQKSLCIAIPYNNLGHLFDDRTLSTLSSFKKANRALGVEIFKLTPPNERVPGGIQDARWDLMSYSARDDVNSVFRLVKKRYRSAESVTSTTSILRYSGHTWYVNLDRIRTRDQHLLRAEAVKRYLLDGEGVKWQPRQDLDQTTHLDEAEVVPILEHDSGNLERGLYAHSRFLVVRTEDHLRHPHFRQAFEETLPPSSRTSQSTPSCDSPFFEMVPTEMSYVWGGHIIRTLKGLPQRLVAETWEVSTHPSGPSSVYPNLRQPIPLREILRSSDATSDGDLSFMTKYLDCHESLSVQVHPNRATARYLSKNGLQLQDTFGKEESFYVIQKAAHRKVHLFLGFDRDSLAPIAQYLRPILLNYAGTIAASELWQCYNQLVVGLQDCLDRECLEEVAQALGMEPAECRTSFLHSFREEKLKDSSCRSLQRVFRYHVEEDGSSNANQEPGSLSLLGKEYLFAAIGIVRFIEEIATYVSDRETDRALQEAAQRLFGVSARENGRVDQITPTLLRYFRGQEVRQGSWVRVPSGTTHSWQGGGNFLIELAQRSDNTFRILDFGRELSAATRREMHYLQAMYSLSADGILDEVSSPRLIFNTEVTRTMSEATPEYHSELDCHFLAETNAQSLETPAWSVLMNPDNPVRLLTDTSAGGLFSELSVGRCRSVLITRTTRIRHLKMHPNDRLLLVSDRSERTDLVCISLGLSKLEVALHRIGESPSIVWYQGKRPKRDEVGGGYLDKVMDVICENLAELLKKTTAGPDESGKLGVKHKKKLRVAVSWPGYIRFKEGEKELHSSGFPKVNAKGFQSSLLRKIRDLVSGTYEVSPESKTNPLILNDAFASALGEYRHPLGWLLEDKSGMVLNIGSGICAGLYKAKTKTESEGSLSDEDQSTIEACSAVGRWLYFDPNTGNIRLPFRPVAQGRLSHALRDHVFSERVPDRIGGYLRASVYLSSRGLILRFLTRLPKPKEFFGGASAGWEYAKIEPFLRQRNDDPVRSFLTGCAAIAANPDDFPIHRMIHRINHEAAGAPVGNRLIARKLIIEVAQELAEVLQQVIRMLEQLAPEYADCIGRVVLTGAVGEHFGRISAKPGFFQASRDKPQDDIADEDFLLGVMKRCLTSFGLRQQPDKVRRSEIAVASVREIEGFLHYLAMQS